MDTPRQSGPSDKGGDSCKREGTQYVMPIVIAESQGSEGDSDDTLTGYASETSSNDSEHSFGELSEIANDVSLRSGAKTKVIRPVYINQLVQYLRSGGTANDQESSMKVEIALKYCEDLVRRKADFGSELGM